MPGYAVKRLKKNRGYGLSHLTRPTKLLVKQPNILPTLLRHRSANLYMNCHYHIHSPLQLYHNCASEKKPPRTKLWRSHEPSLWCLTWISMVSSVPEPLLDQSVSLSSCIFCWEVNAIWFPLSDVLRFRQIFFQAELDSSNQNPVLKSTPGKLAWHCSRKITSIFSSHPSPVWCRFVHDIELIKQRGRIPATFCGENNCKTCLSLIKWRVLLTANYQESFFVQRNSKRNSCRGCIRNSFPISARHFSQKVNTSSSLRAIPEILFLLQVVSFSIWFSNSQEVWVARQKWTYVKIKMPAMFIRGSK